ncbi:hypothetical protein ISS37_01350 [candidate division KSB1 bacterium]|nr:hypothetical protein [candidate division KSB1 bacterium]
MNEFKIKDIKIPNIEYFNRNRIGIVKVQMPEQCQKDGIYKIKEEEKQNNIHIVENVLNKYNNNIFSEGNPNFIVFPELSVSMEAAELMIVKLKNGEINTNTIIIFGLEQITKNQFLELISNSNSKDDFNEVDFGRNIKFVNTAAILIKDKNGKNYIYYQPKLSKSRYETTQQFISKIIYIFNLGVYTILILICSDFILERGKLPIIYTLFKDLDYFYKNPRHEKIDLMFLIQNNKHPIGNHYTKIIKSLYFKSHTIDTTKTMVCSINSVDTEDVKHFRNSNVAVMNRGRFPETLKDMRAENLFAWKSFKKEAGEQDSLQYILWRLRYPGVISFILNMNDTTFRFQDENVIPIEEPGLEKINTNFELTEIKQIPEIYEFKEILLDDFSDFIETLFSKYLLRQYFSNIEMYENMFCNLFMQRPCEVIRTLLFIREENKRAINCDLWDEDKGTFKYFFVSLAMLNTNYEGIEIEENKIKSDDIFISIIDCDNMQDLQFRQEKGELLLSQYRDMQIVLLQRLGPLYLDWNGEPKRFNELLNLNKIVKTMKRPDSYNKITKPKYPYVLTLCYLINKLNARQSYKKVDNIKETLNECFQFI